MRTGRRLKCLSARFVIDIDTVEVEALTKKERLKCLSARFVIDIHREVAGMGDLDGVSNAFRLDS